MKNVNNTPIATLFTLMSVDGKISTGETDGYDFDVDLPKIHDVNEGLQQYYDIESTTDDWSLISGRVLSKTGMCIVDEVKHVDVSYAVLDNTHLNMKGIINTCNKGNNVILYTSNSEHIAFTIVKENLKVVLIEKNNLKAVMQDLYLNQKCKRITVQTGGTINAALFKANLIDYVDAVVAPLIVGGVKTPTLCDGSFISLEDLSVLELLDITKLNNSYIRLRYKVRRK